MESEWNVRVRIVGVVSRRRVWVATGCGCKEVYRFPRTTYPYSPNRDVFTLRGAYIN